VKQALFDMLCFCVEFLEFWARQLVKNPNEVDVLETSGDVVSMLELGGGRARRRSRHTPPTS
jgi:hypothetical protein